MNLGIDAGLATECSYNYDWNRFDNLTEVWTPLASRGITSELTIPIPAEEADFMVVRISSECRGQPNWTSNVDVYLRTIESMSVVGIERSDGPPPVSTDRSHIRCGGGQTGEQIVGTIGRRLIARLSWLLIGIDDSGVLVCIGAGGIAVFGGICWLLAVTACLVAIGLGLLVSVRLFRRFLAGSLDHDQQNAEHDRANEEWDDDASNAGVH